MASLLSLAGQNYGCQAYAAGWQVWRAGSGLALAEAQIDATSDTARIEALEGPVGEAASSGYG